MVSSQTQTSENQYVIPDSVIETYPDLVELIKITEAMNLEEKNYWFKIMPMMTDEQIENLRSILIKERQKLDEINHKYSNDLEEINDRHQSEIQNIEQTKQKEELKQAEAEAEVSESEEEQALLEELAQL